MRLLAVSFLSATDLLDCYSDGYPYGALFCRTRAALRLDDTVVVEIDMPGLPNRVHLRASVVSLTALGAWVHIHRQDAATRDFLIAVAKDQLADGIARQHRRLPADLPVSCRVEEIDEPTNDAIECRTGDLGAGGAYLRSHKAPAVGTRVRLLIGPTNDSEEQISVEGRVAWADLAGFGVRFDVTDRSGRRRLRTMLRHATETGQVRFASAP